MDISSFHKSGLEIQTNLGSNLPVYTGCSVSRLSTFVNNFYYQPGKRTSQIVDDAFVSYVWSLVVRRPDIRVGLIPQGVPVVWVAPQGGKKSKVSEEELESLRELQGIDEDFHTTPLHDLKLKYGDRLHIACDLKTTFAVITGSHSRVRFIRV